MWPAEVYSLASKAENFVHLACLFGRMTLKMGKNRTILALRYSKKKVFWPALKFELCTSALEGPIQKLLARNIIF